MKKRVYSKILVLSSLFAVGAAGLSSVALIKETKNPIAVKADEVSFVEWKGLFTSGWNPHPSSLEGGNATYLIELSTSITKNDGSNLRDVTGSGDQVTFNGTVITGMSGVEFSHANGDRYVKIKIPKTSVVAAEGKDYFEIHINEGTLFDGYKLRELTVHIDPTTFAPTMVPTKSINTNVTGIKPDEYSGGWFRIDLEGYPMIKKDDTFTVYNYLNFSNKIYINGDQSNLLLTPNKASYSMTMNVAECNGLSFNKNEISTALENIQSVTIPAGTQFPGRTAEKTANYSEYYVTQKDQTFYRYGSVFCEEVETKVKGYMPRVWGANQRAFILDGFTDASGSGGEKTNHPFNFNSNIYINKDPNNCLFEEPNRVSTYYKMAHSNSFGVVLAKNYDTNPELFVTIPAGTQFPDSKAWKGQVGGKVFVTSEEITYARSADGSFKKYTYVDEAANFGTLSLEGFNGSSSDVVCSGAGMTNFPINKLSPFGNRSIHFSFKINNAAGNNFSSNTLINAKFENSTVSGGYKFNFARGYGKIQYGNADIAPTCYFSYTDDVDYRVDMYIVKIDATHVRLAMLMDGFAVVDVVRDCSTDITGDLTQMSVYTTTTGTTTIKNINVDEEAVDLFCEKALKMNELSATSDNYANAKDYFINYLTNNQKELFSSSLNYSSAKDRLEGWAQENSETAFANPNFTGINQYNNNIDLPEEGMKRAYLEFDIKPFNGYSSANIAGSKASINGVNCETIDGFKMYCLDNNGNFVMMDYPATMLSTTEAYPYTFFHADAGIRTPEEYPYTSLGEINMYLDSTGKWVKCSGIHTVTLTDTTGTKTMYIPDGATLPTSDLSKYCSAVYKVDDAEFNISTPITADTNIVLETAEHDYKKVDAKVSTCAVQGNIEYYTCDNDGCDKVFVLDGGEYVEKTMNDVLLPLAEHTVDPNSVEFDFAADGSSVEVTYQCSQCEGTFNAPTNEVVLTSAETKAPTCSEKGETTYTATWRTYSDTLTLENISVTGHDPNKVSEISGKTPTCKENGYKKAFYCSDCGLYYEDEAMTVLIGNYDAYSAWILADGKISNNDQEHTPSQPVIENIVAATCTKPGSHDEVIYCSECGEEISRTPVVDQALGHTPSEAVITNVIEASCTQDGSYDETVYCSVCGETLSSNHIVVPATGHNLGALIPEVAATTEKEGMKAHYVCSVCGQLFDENKKPCTQESLVISKLDPVTPDQPEEGTDKKGIFGCKGSLIASSAIIAGLALAGAALVAAKKKED